MHQTFFFAGKVKAPCSKLKRMIGIIRELSTAINIQYCVLSCLCHAASRFEDGGARRTLCCGEAVEEGAAQIHEAVGNQFLIIVQGITIFSGKHLGHCHAHDVRHDGHCQTVKNEAAV